MPDINIENCHITHYPAAVLREPAKPVAKINDNIRKLVEKMTDIMFEHKGVGLAAPQAGVNLRLFIVSLEGVREDVKVYINPKVTPIGDVEVMEEGCLSVPGIYTKVRRYKKCTVAATDLNGNEFEEEAEGLYARCLQHENDHIDGITIVNKMGTAAKIANRQKLKELTEKFDEGTEK